MIVDLERIRRHLAAFDRAWDDPDVAATQTRRTITAVICAEDVRSLLEYVESTLGFKTGEWGTTPTPEGDDKP